MTGDRSTNRRRGRIATISALVVVLAAGVMASATAAPDPGGSAQSRVTPAQLGRYFGFNTNLAGGNNPLTPASEAELIKNAGGRIQRIGLNWATLQPNGNVPAFPDAPVSASTGLMSDQQYLETTSRRILPIFILLDAPTWASGYTRSCGVLSLRCMFSSYQSSLHPPVASNVKAYATFAAAVAKRYPMAAIETWNEPNTSFFWGGLNPDPVLMANMQCAAYDAIKAVSPYHGVLSPGFATPRTTIVGQHAFDQYYRTMFNAMGRRLCWDALSIHLYPGTEYDGDNSELARLITMVGNARAAVGDRTPVWVTETGISTTHPSYRVSQAQQDDYQVSAIHKLLTIPGIQVVLGASLADHGTPGSTDFSLGMMRADLTPKAGYCHWVELNGQTFPGC